MNKTDTAQDKLLKTKADADNAKPQAKLYRMNAGEGLQLEVRPNGRKYWIYRYRKPSDKKGTVYTIGEYQRLTIRQAKIAMLEVKELVRQGIDPNEQKQQEKSKNGGETFKTVALEWHNNQLGRWSAVNAEQVLRSLEMDVFPHIGGRTIAGLETPDLLQVIRKVEARGSLDKAAKIKQRISSVFRYARDTGKIKHGDPTPSAGAMKARETGHFNALTLADLPAFMGDLARYRSDVMRRAVQFTMLTFARTGTIRAAEWQEIDWENAMWNIPAEHMKMGEAHLIPLSNQAMKLLEELRTFTGNSRLIFCTNRRDQELSPNALLQVIRRMGWKEKTTVHGFRALASSILHESGFQSQIIEKQLAHAERNKVAGAYRYMAEYMPERIRMMQWWADFIDAQCTGVVSPLPDTLPTSKTAPAASNT
jgi:integrase